MLIKEKISENIVKYYSDNNKYIVRVEDNVLFTERMDVVNSKWTYEESTIDLPIKETQEER